MANFSLSQALDGPLEFDDPGSEPSCFNMTDVQDEIFRIDEGLDLVVSQNRKTLRKVAKLLLAVNMMTKSLTGYGKGLRDDELCSAIMENVVTETVVETIRSSSTVKRIFQRLNSENAFTMCDTSQKDIVRASGLKLQAITLKGGQCELKVHFKMSRYLAGCISANDTQTVLLSISSSLHIACSMEDDKATITLKECSEKDLRKISDDGDMDCFLFYKRTQGVNLNSFESVKYPGWFISTSCVDENQLLDMSRVDTANRYTCFKINN